MVDVVDTILYLPYSDYQQATLVLNIMPKKKGIGLDGARGAAH